MGIDVGSLVDIMVKVYEDYFLFFREIGSLVFIWEIRGVGNGMG